MYIVIISKINVLKKENIYSFKHENDFFREIKIKKKKKAAMKIRKSCTQLFHLKSIKKIYKMTR